MAVCKTAGVGPARVALLTVGHGTASRQVFSALLRGAGLLGLVDVRSAPGSRHKPHFGRTEMERWVPEAGLRYRWEPDLGCFRRPLPASPNVALRHPSFRGYADYMMTERFAGALRRVLAEAGLHNTAVMCSETLWWRCHRRLIADAATLPMGAEVSHLGHDGGLTPHRLTEGVRVDVESHVLLYDQVAGELL